MAEKAKKEATSKMKSAQKKAMKVGKAVAKKPTAEPVVYSLWRLKPTLGKKLQEIGAGINNWFFPGNWEDGEFMDDVRQSTLRGAHPAANVMIWALISLFICFLVWASFAELDEVTSGQGKVIPSGQVQIVESFEGGIIEKILVAEGDIVEVGQPMVIIDDTSAASSFSEKMTRLYTLQVSIARLKAMVNNVEPQYPREIIEKAPHIIDSEHALYLSKVSEMRSAIEVLQRQVEQRQQDLKEIITREQQMSRDYALSKKELEMTKPLLAEGVVSEVELLRVERQANQALGEKESAELAIPRAEASIKEAQSRLQETVTRYRSELLKEAGEKKEEFERLSNIITAVEDQVDRTTIRSPVRAAVNRVLVNTVGGVIDQGMEIVELIPLEDTLLVEAQIKPQDIAFLRPNQEAKVKITAYDFSVYGDLPANLVYISADTVQDERGNPFYHIRVRTSKNYLGTEQNKLEIMAGMVASVDILTGKKTVLDYILKPFKKTLGTAMRER